MQMAAPLRVRNAVRTGGTLDLSPNPAVEAYLAAVPQPMQTHIRELRAAILAAVPPESIEVISYAIPAFSLGRPFFGYAAFKKHLAVIPFCGSVLCQFPEELSAYKQTMGSLHLPLEEPIPVELIQRLVQTRLAGIRKR